MRQSTSALESTSARQSAVCRASVRASRRLRAAVEAIERRVLLSSITVNTFVDTIDPPGAQTISLRDAIALAAARPGGDTINVPAGHYNLLLGRIVLDDTSGDLALNAIGGTAVLDANHTADSTDFRSTLSVSNGSATLRNFKFTGGYGTPCTSLRRGHGFSERQTLLTQMRRRGFTLSAPQAPPIAHRAARPSAVRRRPSGTLRAGAHDPQEPWDRTSAAGPRATLLRLT